MRLAKKILRANADRYPAGKQVTALRCWLRNNESKLFKMKDIPQLQKMVKR